MRVHMQVESLALIDIEDGSGKNKGKKICLASFAERLLQMLNLSKKSAARKDGLKIQLEGKVIGTSF